MRLMGQARAEIHANFPLVGVSPTDLVDLPGQTSILEDSAPLEPNHTHFLLVPGNRWGDESHWLAQVASAIASDAPSITVLINGGEVTWQDAEKNLEAGRTLVVIAGSGRTADVLAEAIHGNYVNDRAEKIVQSGLVRSLHLTDGSEALAQIIEEAFMRGVSNGN
jgi:SLOG in TRPM, prokaryote